MERDKEIFYHGTSAIFEAFSDSHTLEGAGKVKFGYGIYVTERYATAAHYAIPTAAHHYVYTVEVPRKTVANYISIKGVVNPLIVRRAEEQLGETIPEDVVAEGKLFRKFIALRLAGKKWGKTQKPTIADERLASEFLCNIGVDFIEWPVNWKNPTEYNRAILDANKISIVKIEEVELNIDKGMSIFSIRASIEKYYPKYYSWNTYPAKDCIAIRKAKEQWGILGNFAQAAVKVDGVEFCCTEQLYQMMKFKDAEPIMALYNKRGMQIKMAMKPFVKRGMQRADWGMMIVDAMKFCLQTKYEQSPDFRNVLASTTGKIIVEDQSSFKKAADTWGAKLNGDVYEGSNLLGRLLMELRDAKHLQYKLPTDALDFINILRGK